MSNQDSWHLPPNSTAPQFYNPGAYQVDPSKQGSFYPPEQQHQAYQGSPYSPPFAPTCPPFIHSTSTPQPLLSRSAAPGGSYHHEGEGFYQNGEPFHQQPRNDYQQPWQSNEVNEDANDGWSEADLDVEEEAKEEIPLHHEQTDSWNNHYEASSFQNFKKEQYSPNSVPESIHNQSSLPYHQQLSYSPPSLVNNNARTPEQNEFIHSPQSQPLHMSASNIADKVNRPDFDPSGSMPQLASEKSSLNLQSSQDVSGLTSNMHSMNLNNFADDDPVQVKQETTDPNSSWCDLGVSSVSLPPPAPLNLSAQLPLQFDPNTTPQAYTQPAPISTDHDDRHDQSLSYEDSSKPAMTQHQISDHMQSLDYNNPSINQQHRQKPTENKSFDQQHSIYHALDVPHQNSNQIQDVEKWSLHQSPQLRQDNLHSEQRDQQQPHKESSVDHSQRVQLQSHNKRSKNYEPQNQHPDDHDQRIQQQNRDGYDQQIQQQNRDGYGQRGQQQHRHSYDQQSQQQYRDGNGQRGQQHDGRPSDYDQRRHPPQHHDENPMHFDQQKSKHQSDKTTYDQREPQQQYRDEKSMKFDQRRPEQFPDQKSLSLDERGRPQHSDQRSLPYVPQQRPESTEFLTKQSPQHYDSRNQPPPAGQQPIRTGDSKSSQSQRPIRPEDSKGGQSQHYGHYPDSRSSQHSRQSSYQDNWDKIPESASKYESLPGPASQQSTPRFVESRSGETRRPELHNRQGSMASIHDLPVTSQPPARQQHWEGSRGMDVNVSQNRAQGGVDFSNSQNRIGIPQGSRPTPVRRPLGAPASKLSQKSPVVNQPGRHAPHQSPWNDANPGMFYPSGPDYGQPQRPSSRSSISSEVDASDERRKQEEYYKQWYDYMQYYSQYYSMSQQQQDTSGGGEADPYAAYYQYYYGQWNQYGDTADTGKDPSGRLTPKLYTMPHRRVCMMAPGLMIQNVPSRPDEGEPARVELHWTSLLSSALLCSPEDRLDFATFPGPLTREGTFKADVRAYLKDKLVEVQDRMPTDWESAALLIAYLDFLVKNNGIAHGDDLADLLLEGHDTRTSDLRTRGLAVTGSMEMLASLPPSEPPSGRCSPSDRPSSRQHSRQAGSRAGSVVSGAIARTHQMVDPHYVDDRALDRFRKLLMYGRRMEALEYACRHDLWGHAFALAHQLALMPKILTRFLNKAIRMNDPLQTLHQMMSNQIPVSVTSPLGNSFGDPNDSLDWGDWRPHLAMILSVAPDKPQLAASSMEKLGDTLAGQHLVYASQLCYLLAGVPFCNAEGNNGKIFLIGADHHRYTVSSGPTTGRQPGSRKVDVETVAVNEAIQLTEIYEYAMSLANRDFFLPHLQPYKYLYAIRLLDAGLVEPCFRYCHSISRALIHSPSLFGNALISGVLTLAERLQYHPDCEVTFSSNEWIQHLRATFNHSQANRPSVPPSSVPSQPQPPTSQQNEISPEHTVTNRNRNQSTLSNQAEEPQHQVPSQNQFQPPQQPAQNQFQPPQSMPNQFQPPQQVQNQFQPPQSFPNQFQPPQQQVQNQFQPPQSMPNQFQPPQPGQNQFQPPQSMPNQFQPPSSNQYQASVAGSDQSQQSPSHMNGTSRPPAFFQPEGQTNYFTPNPSASNQEQQNPNEPTNENFDYFAAYAGQTYTRSGPRSRTTSQNSSEHALSSSGGAANLARSRQSSSTSDAPRRPSVQQTQPTSMPPNKTQEDITSEPSASGQPQDGWFSGFVNRFKKTNGPREAILPDDKKPTIVWDPTTKRWVDSSASEEDNAPPPPPPKLAPSIAAPSMPMPPAGGVRQPRSRYVNVLAGQTKPPTTGDHGPQSIFPPMPGSAPQPPPPVQQQPFFVPGAPQ